MNAEDLDVESDYGSDVSDQGLTSLDYMKELDDMACDIFSQQTAAEYVKDVLSKSSPEEIATMKFEYFKNRASSSPSSGGAGPDIYDVSSIEEVDVGMFKVFELNDSIHDFGSYHNYDYIRGLIMGDTVAVGMNRYMTHGDFMDFMTINQNILFEEPGRDAWYKPSPLDGADYRNEVMSRPEYGSNYSATLRCEYLYHESRLRNPIFQSVEVWTGPAEDSKWRSCKLAQVCAFCNATKYMFGIDARFMLDVLEPIVRLILSYTLVDKELKKQLADQGGDSDVPIPVHIEKIKPLKLLLEVGKGGDVEYPMDDFYIHPNTMDVNNWTFVKCDASLLDGSKHRGTLITDATGLASHPQSRVRVTLHGATPPNQFLYTVNSDVYLSDLFRDVEEMNVTKTVKNHVWTTGHGDKHADLYSTGEVKAYLASKAGGDAHIARILAVKRAGDWGQVEHCKKHDIVFVTHDKPAFLYAIMRRTKAMLFLEDSTKAKEGDIVMYTFVMYNPKPPLGLQRGGSKTGWTVNAMLFVVLVAGAIAGSMFRA